MKTSGHLIFYISENEDFELWRVLTQITPEDRAAFIKKALNKALQQESEAKLPIQAPIFRMDKELGDTALSDLALEELGYAAISATVEKTLQPLADFTGEGNSNSSKKNSASKTDFSIGEEEEYNFMQLEELLKPTAYDPNSSIPGLDFLLTNVIGEENDENVIELLRKRKAGIEE